jgi:glycosyltransferase involved in cell wall biosynthesis
MKILHSLSYFLPARAFGGPISSTYFLCRELARRGHEVTLFTTNLLAPGKVQRRYPREEVMDGIRVVRFGVPFTFLSYFPAPSMLPSLLKVEADILHAHGFRNFHTDSLGLASLLRGIPLVLHPRGMAVPSAGRERGSQRADRIYRAYDFVIGNRLLKQAERVIATTLHERDQLATLPPLQGKIEVLPHGVDTDLYRRDAELGERFRERYGIDGLLLLYVGRIDLGKNLEALLRVFSRLQKTRDSITLVLVGEEVASTAASPKRYRSFLEDFARRLGIPEERILFTGGLYGEDLLSAYSAADLFINPSISRAENFGLVNLEAAACELPVIAGPAGVAPDLLEEFPEFLFRSEEGLFQALEGLLTDEAFLRRVGKRLRKKAERDYSWPEVASRLEDLYREVCSS